MKQILYLIQGVVLTTTEEQDPSSFHNVVPKWNEKLDEPKMFAGSFMEYPPQSGNIVGAIFFTTGEQEAVSVMIEEDQISFDVRNNETTGIDLYRLSRVEGSYWTGTVRIDEKGKYPVSCFIRAIDPAKLYNLDTVRSFLKEEVI